MGNLVWGYFIDEFALLQYGLRKGLGTKETPNAQRLTIYHAAMDLLARAKIAGYAEWTGAIDRSGAFHRCFALARVTDDPRECFGKPNQESIDNWKKVLKTDKEPRWYEWC
ncbi:hypothetical protein H2248_008704 [Termitomyces sp. 'cryptogamus']|nr:hypothetical protein H2248_008704 [Termitomyces sp. 'cryptogamus']